MYRSNTHDLYKYQSKILMAGNTHLLFLKKNLRQATKCSSKKKKHLDTSGQNRKT